MVMVMVMETELPYTEIKSIDLPGYCAEPTIARFHASNAFVRGLMGPIGSSKSSACCLEILKRAREQVVYNGVRSSRWAAVRSTYPELKSTTIKTWQDWFPEEVCTFKWDVPICARMHIKEDDGTITDLEMYFLALDRPEDVKKLLSLELTGLWLNEAKELAKAHLDMGTGRVRRYPSKRRGGFNWSGVIMDTNPPDEDHWYYELAEVVRPQNHEFFKQPPAMFKFKDGYIPNCGQVRGVPQAENVRNLPAGWAYYQDIIQGKREEWINVYVKGEYGTVAEGRPVYPEFNRKIHVATGELELYRGLKMILGFDFGLTPACLFAQLSPTGQLRVYDELCADYMAIDQFSKNMLKPYLANNFPNMETVEYCDPAGTTKAQTDERSCIDILKVNGFNPTPARTNDLLPRRDAVVSYLTKLCGNGDPGFIINSKCKTLIRGFEGGYSFDRVQVSGEERFKDMPKKNRYSHIHDALQYTAMMAGGQTSLQRPRSKARPIQNVSAAGWS